MVRRRMRPASRRARFKTASLVVSLNLETNDRRPARWVEVRRVFSAPVRAASADTWVVFLCTNVNLSEARILEVYSLRWSIEVYFKEIKQWQLFRALIEGALEGLIRDLGRRVIKKVLAAIDQSVEGFLNQALQISPEQIAVQLKAEELGYL